MSPLFQIGRYFLAIAIAFFGAQLLAYGHYLGGLPPVPPWAPGGAPGAYLSGVLLLVTGIGIATRKYGRVSALVLGTFFVLCVLILHTPHLHDILYSGNDRTRALEPLALGAAAFVLASALSTEDSPASQSQRTTFSIAGRMAFALTLFIFGWQHFKYIQYLVTLVPSWIPWHWFWIAFTGSAFIAVGLAILTGILERLGAGLLGLMFLLWFLILHLPRCFAALHNPDEWTSAFIALAMCGACWIIAITPRKA